MRYALTALLAAVVAATMAVAGCGQSDSAPASPGAQTQPGKGADTTKPASVPTKAPAPTARKVEYPAKGTPITFICPWPADSAAGVGARLLAGELEKTLGTTVQVANRTGGSGVVGTTELVKSKPDGYTLGMTNTPATLISYVNPELKATYTRRDFQPLALLVDDPSVVAVKADSPYRTIKDLLDAVKAGPEKVKGSTTGIMSDDHLNLLMWEKQAGGKIASVPFDGDSQAIAGLLDGQVDAYFGTASGVLARFKAREALVLGVMDTQESKLLSGVKTMDAQGYKLYFSSAWGVSLPPGVAREVIDVLSAAIKKALQSPEQIARLEEMGLTPRYQDSEQFRTHWTERETVVKSLFQMFKQ